jgi:hypothetical protein
MQLLLDCDGGHRALGGGDDSVAQFEQLSLLQGHALPIFVYHVNPPLIAACPHRGQTRFRYPS